MKYYVYEWFNTDNNEVFYVGKGTGRRYKVKSRNIKFNNYILENKVDVRIVSRFDDEISAFKHEEELFNKYLKLGQCQCNMKYGGNGGVSEVWTDEMKEKMSIFNPMKSENQRKRMSEKNPMKNKDVSYKVGNSKRKKPIINGEVFEKAEEAAKKYNVHKFTIYNWCKRGYDTHGNKCGYLNCCNKTNKEFKRTNSKKVIIDDTLFDSVREASEFLDIWPETLIRNIKKGRKIKNHSCRYANQQPSHENSD